MEKLMGAGVPYHEGIIGLIQDLEFHYQTGQGEILSSIEQVEHFDVVSQNDSDDEVPLLHAPLPRQL